ncbi:hypothetical protein J1N35_007859 [Gossypium stocksii]|uniref:Uncharacterized protein n=1 Tax=Gossypium stocksii TaxID=47602 RepID=A0A9D4AG23_9ROSI|nr:hypothetical protein J1N35_007859 [Gossypium stocksii]
MRLARFLVSIPIRIMLVGLGGVLLFMFGYLGCPALLGSTSRVLSEILVSFFLLLVLFRAPVFDSLSFLAFVLFSAPTSGSRSEKIGERRKPRIAMKEFEKVLDEMALVDVKTDKGWFTWSNNRDGSGFVRESCSDHYAIFLNSKGHKPNDDVRDSRLFFKFEACWAKDRDAKQLIKRISDKNHNPCNLIDHLDKIHSCLGPGQHAQYNSLRSRMRSLIKWIDSLIDESYMRSNLKLLKSNRSELGRLYAKKESYWA